MDKEQLLYHYFSNGLTPEQERQFNALLSTDTEFKQQFDFEKDIKRVIREKKSKDLKIKLSGFEKNISKNSSIPKETSVSKETPIRSLPRTNYRKWAMAASIALLLGLGWFGYHNFAGPDYGGLYYKNFQQYPNTVYAITRGDTDDTSLERSAFVAYETDEKVQAISLFKELKKDKDTEDINFYLAQAYLQNDQPLEAVSLFTQIVQGKGEFAPQALWYAALAHLKMEEKENASRALRNLIADGRYKKSEALKLLKKLE